MIHEQLVDSFVGEPTKANKMDMLNHADNAHLCLDLFLSLPQPFMHLHCCLSGVRKNTFEHQAESSSPQFSQKFFVTCCKSPYLNATRIHNIIKLASFMKAKYDDKFFFIKFRARRKPETKVGGKGASFRIH